MLLSESLDTGVQDLSSTRGLGQPRHVEALAKGE